MLKRAEGSRIQWALCADTGFTQHYCGQLASVGNGLNPLRHYLEKGWLRGLDPNEFFDTDYYLKASSESVTCGLSPLEHFIAVDLWQGRRPNPSIDTDRFVSLVEAQDSRQKAAAARLTGSPPEIPCDTDGRLRAAIRSTGWMREGRRNEIPGRPNSKSSVNL